VSPRLPPDGRYGGTFTATIFAWSGPAAWHFVTVPDDVAPRVTHRWGRTPVTATVEGTTWETSVWREKSGRTLLAIPKKVRGAKGDGDSVVVSIQFDIL
jgi:hypothetical protein